MAKKVTQEDIIKINDLYYELKNKAAVARATGFSASTVAKYIIKDYLPKEKVKIEHFNEELPPFNIDDFKGVNFSRLCLLSEVEKIEMKILWKELSL